MSSFEDLTGMKFGMLTIIGPYERSKCSARRYMAKCDCGRVVPVYAGHVKHQQSCGCIRGKHHSTRHYKHYMTGKRLYNIWSSMKARCMNPNSDAYDNYGGRGITVCESWLDFEQFKNWAMSSGYNDTLTIERIDVNKGYCPENCTWATRIDQARNRRSSRYLTYNNETHTLAEWADILNIKYHTLCSRINNYGWSIEKAFTTPVRGA